MYPKFKEIAPLTQLHGPSHSWEPSKRGKQNLKKPFCTFHLLDGAIAIIANLWNTEKKDIYKVQEKSVISVQLYKSCIMEWKHTKSKSIRLLRMMQNWKIIF